MPGFRVWSRDCISMPRDVRTSIPRELTADLSDASEASEASESVSQESCDTRACCQVQYAGLASSINARIRRRRGLSRLHICSCLEPVHAAQDSAALPNNFCSQEAVQSTAQAVPHSIASALFFLVLFCRLLRYHMHHYL